MNRRKLLRGLIAAPIAAAVAPLVPAGKLSVGPLIATLELDDKMSAAFAEVTAAAEKSAADMTAASASMREGMEEIVWPSWDNRWHDKVPAHPMCRCTLMAEDGTSIHIGDLVRDPGEPLTEFEPVPVGVLRHEPISFEVEWVDNELVVQGGTDEKPFTIGAILDGERIAEDVVFELRPTGVKFS